MRLALFCLLTLPFITAQAVVLKVTSIPSYTPSEDTLFVVGDFNNWNPADTNYALKAHNDSYYVTINATSFSYKFTRGSWSKVEGNASGSFLPNRSYQASQGDTVTLSIVSWEDLHGNNSGGTRSPNVSILDDDFFIPQLNRYRRIWIYLPPDYDAVNEPRQVVYMHDAQNLFDAATSFAGEWEVDETLDELENYAPIVVGIDNGGAERINELAPWYNQEYNAGGDGDSYLDFIAYTLKPYIDSNYNTMPEPHNTTIFGSSLGGLISMYGVAEYGNVFRKAGVFSPAYWFNPEIFDFVSNATFQTNVQVYHLAGGQESGVVENVSRMDDILRQKGLGNPNLRSKTVANGQHAEWFWRQEFREAIDWLVLRLDLSIDANGKATKSFFIYPNPSNGKFYLDAKTDITGPLEVYDSRGLHLQNIRWTKNQEIDLSHLQSGLYFLRSPLSATTQTVFIK